MRMRMGTAENSGYGYTHFWVWTNTRVLGMGMGIAHKILAALENYSIFMFNYDWHNNTRCFHLNLCILALIFDSDKFLQQNLYSIGGE